MEKKKCVRCLLREYDQDEYMQNLHDYISQIDSSEKVEDNVYEDRLNVCKECDLLIQGMCRACGCFVELRAALKTNNCPYEKW